MNGGSRRMLFFLLGLIPMGVAAYFYFAALDIMIQAKGIDEFTAGRAALRTELLHVAQRDPCFGGELERAELRIGKAVLDDPADAREQLVRMAGDGLRIGRRK
jgi:hypothetical protein